MPHYGSIETRKARPSMAGGKTYSRSGKTTFLYNTYNFKHYKWDPEQTKKEEKQNTNEKRNESFSLRTIEYGSFIFSHLKNKTK